MTRSYWEKQDGPMLRRWLVERGMSTDLRLPALGLVCDEIAMGFIIEDAPLCYLDFIIADPEAPKSARRSALPRLIAALEELGTELGATEFRVASTAPTLQRLFADLGFQSLGKNFEFFALRREA